MGLDRVQQPHFSEKGNEPSDPIIEDMEDTQRGGRVRIRAISYSNLGSETCYSEMFSCSQSLQTQMRNSTVPYIIRRLLPSISFPIHPPVIILPSEGINSVLLTAPLNKAQIINNERSFSSTKHSARIDLIFNTDTATLFEQSLSRDLLTLSGKRFIGQRRGISTM
jgi:hypothetical protein